MLDPTLASAFELKIVFFKGMQLQIKIQTCLGLNVIIRDFNSIMRHSQANSNFFV